MVDWNADAQETLKRTLEVASQPNTNVARNVILFLGDGMGISTITAGRIYMGQKNGGTGEEAQLAFDRFPHVALAKVC
jgi:alkaline phosphatase